jgi:hypothetical protein
MVDRASRFVLPLMDHLVEEGVEHLVPTMSAKMTPTNGNLARPAMLRGGVVTEAALHSARDANRNRTKGASEMLIVESCMPGRKSLGDWLILGSRSLAAHGTARRVDNVRDDAPLCSAPFGSRSSFDKRDDGLMHLDRCAEVALVDAQLAAAEAHHDVPVPRQLTPRDALEAE